MPLIVSIAAGPCEGVWRSEGYAAASPERIGCADRQTLGPQGDAQRSLGNNRGDDACAWNRLPITDIVKRRVPGLYEAPNNGGATRAAYWSNHGLVFRPIFIGYLIPAPTTYPPDPALRMTEQLNLEDWAWQISAEVYRLNLYSRLTGKAEPNRSSVTDEELAEAIRDSFTQMNEIAYREMVKLATEAALETYDRVVSSVVKRSRVRLRN